MSELRAILDTTHRPCVCRMCDEVRLGPKGQDRGSSALVRAPSTNGSNRAGGRAPARDPPPAPSLASGRHEFDDAAPLSRSPARFLEGVADDDDDEIGARTTRDLTHRGPPRVETPSHVDGFRARYPAPARGERRESRTGSTRGRWRDGPQRACEAAHAGTAFAMGSTAPWRPPGWWRAGFMDQGCPRSATSR
jgi:hypothetical protein